MSDRFYNQNLPQILKEKYEILDCLANKGGRKTLLARDLTNKELVIIKLLSFGNDLTWEDLKLFEREAETLKSINHDFIPSYIDSFEIKLENNQAYALVQTYIDAPSVEQQIQTGISFSEAEIKEFATDILKILDYLHSRQLSIIHRDIKPSNILLKERSPNSIGDIYLVDFGSVQNLATKKGGTITVVGTYGYMPPEQFGGRAKPASDLYSLGATLIYLITGQHPADLPENDLKIEFEQLVNISPGLANWLRKMTEPSLSNRYKSAKEALQELEKCHLYNQQTFQHKKADKKAINQPKDSKVIFQKNSKIIKITIAPAGLFSNVSYANLGTLAFMALFAPLLQQIFLYTIYNKGFIELAKLNYFVWLLKLVGQAIAAVIIVRTVYFLIKLCLGIFGEMQLTINSNRIYLIYKLFGVKRHSPMPSLRKDIYRLEKVFQPNNKSYLKIWAKKQTYNIAKSIYFPLTNLEVNWLAQELSSWLNLPIIEEYEMSDKIKPELAEAHQIKASAYFDLQDYQMAIKHCNQALRYDLESYQTYYILGLSKCKIDGTFSSGINDLKKAVEIAKKQKDLKFADQTISKIEELKNMYNDNLD